MLQQIRKPAAVMLLLSTAACTSLQPVKEPTGFFAQKAPTFVVVITSDAEATETMVLRAPRLEAGTLTGTFDGEQVSVPMTRVRTVSAVQRDRKKTMWAIIGSSVAAGLVTYMMVGNGNTISNDKACLPEGYRNPGDLPYCD